MRKDITEKSYLLTIYNVHGPPVPNNGNENRLVFRGILNTASIPQWADLRLTLPCSIAFLREYIGTMLYTID
jgi:hypothetical protein